MTYILLLLLLLEIILLMYFKNNRMSSTKIKILEVLVKEFLKSVSVQTALSHTVEGPLIKSDY